jgi:hypothetical protein
MQHTTSCQPGGFLNEIKSHGSISAGAHTVDEGRRAFANVTGNRNEGQSRGQHQNFEIIDPNSLTGAAIPYRKLMSTQTKKREDGVDHDRPSWAWSSVGRTGSEAWTRTRIGGMIATARDKDSLPSHFAMPGSRWIWPRRPALLPWSTVRKRKRYFTTILSIPSTTPRTARRRDISNPPCISWNLFPRLQPWPNPVSS